MSNELHVGPGAFFKNFIANKPKMIRESRHANVKEEPEPLPGARASDSLREHRTRMDSWNSPAFKGPEFEFDF